MPKHSNETIRQAVHWLTDEEYLQLKVPHYPSTRAMAAAAFLIAQPKHWVQIRYLSKDKGSADIKYSASQYIINFKRDAANEFIMQQRGGWWLERCLLPVDWYYQHALKDETNMGWLNLSNVMHLDTLDSTGKTIRSYTTGVIPSDDWWHKYINLQLDAQQQKYGFTVKTISQDELIEQALASQGRRSYKVNT